MPLFSLYVPVGGLSRPLWQALFVSADARVSAGMNTAIDQLNDSPYLRQGVSEPVFPDCPKCGNALVVQLLKSMRKWDRAHDWFRCDRCGQLYTRPRTGN